MAKLGDEYNQIVAAVEKALDPGATVTIKKWLHGPDGKREVDVEVRGTVNGIAKFILVECKDYTHGKTPRPVDITDIDELDSKRHDLEADETIIYSNSGFSKKALNKARRVGIRTASAMKAGDGQIRVSLISGYIGQVLSVEEWAMKIYPTQESHSKIPNDWQTRELLYHGLPVVNWISAVSDQLVYDYRDHEKIVVRYTFRKKEDFSHRGIPITLFGFELTLVCKKKWVSQSIPIDVTLGLYDYLAQEVVVPANEALTIGPFDNSKWEEIDESTEGLYPDIVLSRPVIPQDDSGVPALDELIGRTDIQVYHPNALE